MAHHGAELLAGAMQPHCERPGGAAERSRSFTMAQSVPGNEQQRFALKRGQLAQRRKNDLAEDERLPAVLAGLSERASDAFDESVLAARRPTLIGEYTTRHAEKPTPRLLRHVRQPTPRDLEGPGNRVDSRFGIGSRFQIAGNRPKVLCVQPLKALLVGRRWPNSPKVHIREVAGTTGNLTSRRPKRPSRAQRWSRRIQPQRGIMATWPKTTNPPRGILDVNLDSEAFS